MYWQTCSKTPQQYKFEMEKESSLQFNASKKQTFCQ